MTPTRDRASGACYWESSNRLISDISAMPVAALQKLTSAELRRVQQSTKRLLGVGTPKSSKDDEPIIKMFGCGLWLSRIQSLQVSLLPAGARNHGI